MAPIGAQILYFLSSYALFFFLLAVKACIEDTPFSTIIAGGLVVIGALSVGGVFYYLYDVRKGCPDTITPVNVVPTDDRAASYLITYLLPFLDVKFGSTPDLAMLAIFFLALCTVHVNSNLTYINPVLNWRGYHFYQIEEEGGKVYGLITKQKYIRQGDPLSVYLSQNYLAIEEEASHDE